MPAADQMSIVGKRWRHTSPARASSPSVSSAAGEASGTLVDTQNLRDLQPTSQLLADLNRQLGGEGSGVTVVGRPEEVKLTDRLRPLGIANIGDG